MAILAAVSWLDTRIKSQAPLRGYCPSTAEAVLYSSDFGTFWGEALNTEAVQRIRAEWRGAGSGIELHVRKLTGVRPTPTRWRLWMGQRFLSAKTPNAFGVCTYPGLLLRGVSKVHGWLRAPVDASGVRAYGDVYFAWRDGFLIASQNPDYVRAALASDPIEMKPGVSPHAVVFESRIAPIVSLELVASDEFPIRGEIPSTVSARSAPMTLPSAWSDPPMAACSATAWEDIASLLSVADGALTHSAYWNTIREAGNELFTTWNLATPPPTWQDNRLDHCSLLLSGFDATSTVAYPELAFVVRSTLPAAGSHPLEGVLPPEMEGIPYEWAGYPGMLYPMTGSQWAPCLGHHGRDWLATSRERLMRSLTENLDEGPPVEADFTVQVDWQQVSTTLLRVLMNVEDLELFPEMSAGEVRSTLMPIAKSIRHVGRTVILGNNVDGTNTINGLLARRTPESAS